MESAVAYPYLSYVDDTVLGKEFVCKSNDANTEQQRGVRDKNFSAARPKGSMSLNRLRWESMTCEHGFNAPKHNSNITSSQFKLTRVSNNARVTMHN